MVTIIMQGGSIDLHEEENFNKVRKRCNDATRAKVDYENGNIDDKSFQPFHDLSFKTDDGGRIAVNAEKVIAVVSDTEKD
jgi:hypothetical protein